MGEGYYGMSDEFIMFVLVPLLLLVVSYPFRDRISKYER
jgi:hypothetical protein